MVNMIEKICIDCGNSFKTNDVSNNISCQKCYKIWDKITSLEKLIKIKYGRLVEYNNKIEITNKRIRSAQVELHKLYCKLNKG